MDNSFQEISNAMESFVSLLTDDALMEYNCDDFTRFSSNNHEYPMLWATPLNMNVVTGQVTFRFQVAFMDTVYEKQSLVKTLSDTSITVTEFLTHFDDDNDNCFYSVVLSSDFTPFYRGIDKVAGWQGNVDFQLRYQANKELVRYK